MTTKKKLFKFRLKLDSIGIKPEESILDFQYGKKAQKIINNLWNHCLSNRTIKFLTVSLPSLDFNFSIAGRNEEEEKNILLPI